MKTFCQKITTSVLILSLGCTFVSATFAADKKSESAQTSASVTSSPDIERTLKEFVVLASADAALRSFLSEKKLMLEYCGSDSEVALHIGIADGKYAVALGHPAKPAEITFRCDLKTLDRVLREESAAEELRAEVRLGFFRKIGLADCRDELFTNLSRVYARAIQNVNTQNQTKLLAAQATP